MHTYNTDLKNRLTAYAEMYPEQCKLTDDDEQGGLTFEIETTPYSDERRRAASELAKRKVNTGIK